MEFVGRGDEFSWLDAQLGKVGKGQGDCWPSGAGGRSASRAC
jgi:hypothetical protein